MDTCIYMHKCLMQMHYLYQQVSIVHVSISTSINFSTQPQSLSIHNHVDIQCLAYPAVYIYIIYIYIIIYIHTHFRFTYLVAATPKKMPNSIYILHISSYRPTFLSWHLWGYQTCYPTWLFHIAVTRKSPLLSSMESMGHGFAMQQWLFIIRPIVDP